MQTLKREMLSEGEFSEAILAKVSRVQERCLRLFKRTQIPDAFTCPIGQTLMVDPVVCRDGHTYERTNIMEWFAAGHTTSPSTNEVLADQSIIENYKLRAAIESFNARCCVSEPLT